MKKNLDKASYLFLLALLATPNMLFGMAGKSLTKWWNSPGAKAAFVLPYYVNQQNKKTYYIIGREVGGPERGKFSSFGGKAYRNERKPHLTAGREFFEEANLGRLGWSKQGTQDYIKLRKGRTKNIVAFHRPITAIYITYLNQQNARNLLKKFNYRTNKDKEMNLLAEVRHDRLVNALRKNSATVEATVWAQGKQQRPNRRIPLRSIMYKLKPYFTGGRYKTGTDKRIRFY